MIHALLVDDEINNIENLKFILTHDCQGIEVIATATSAQEARKQLAAHSIDAIFLDINMPQESGFQFLQQLGDHSYAVVFVTAYNEYSLQAIKASAVDYLLKPLQLDDVQQAVEKIKKAQQHQQAAELNKTLLKNFLNIASGTQAPQRIALPQLGSIIYLEVSEISSLQADGNYTIIHQRDMQKRVISKTLKDFEEILDAQQFVRIHKSSIINIHEVKEYLTQDGGLAKMNDGNEWTISRRQLDVFLARMNDSALLFRKSSGQLK